LVDPTGANRFWIPWSVKTGMITCNYPFTISSTLLIAFYWQELLSFSRMTSSLIPSLKVLRVPCGIIIFVMFALEITASVLRGVWIGATAMYILVGVVYTIISLVTAIFFIITGVRMVRILKIFSGKTNKVHTKLVVLIMATGSSLLWWFCFAVLIPTPVFNIPIGYVLIQTLSYVGLYGITFTHILVFSPEKPESDDSTPPDAIATQKSTGKEDETAESAMSADADDDEGPNVIELASA